MTRRALSPAAHGVLLAVRAALRGRVPQITDAADGTTSVVVLDPDGTRILRCEVRSVSRARDTRQPLLPLAPGAPHTPPAPVAVVPSRVAEATAPQDDDGPAPINGVCAGDKIHLDDEPIEVMGVDHEGFTWRTVATDARGRSVDEGDVLWREVAEGRPGHWRVTEVEAKASREKPLRPTKAAKPKLARLTAEPQADAVAAGYRGAIAIMWQATEGAAWERVWSAPSPKAAEIDSAWKAACEAHRARQYNRGGRCTRDSLDGAS